MPKHAVENPEPTMEEREALAKRIVAEHNKLRKALFEAQQRARGIESMIKEDGTLDINGRTIQSIRGALNLASSAQVQDHESWRTYHRARARTGY
jgi:hypothetical protein